MSDDYTDGTKPNKESGKIAVDDMGIPILEEVVGQKKSVSKPVETIANKPKAPEPPKAPSLNFSLPDNEILVTALRNQLRSQINKDIDEIAADISGNIVSNLTQELEHKVKTQIIEILQRNLDDMINHAISKDPKRES
jgi:hypothetical protein